MTKKRIYGLDLLRILSMLGIIGLHILNAGGLMNAASSPAQLAIARFWASICYCSVNVFAMLTGFLYIEKSNIRSSNLMDLLSVAAFYCISVFTVFLCLKPELFTNAPNLVIYSLFPPLKGRYWFITAYILVFMMIPYINAMIRALTKQQFEKMLLVLFVLLSLVPTFGLRDYFKTMDGYSPMWLICCYLVGAYIKLYRNENTSKQVRNSLIIFFVNVAAVTVLGFLSENIFTHLCQYTSPFMVVNAICLVLAFSRLSISNVNIQKVLLRMSGSAFGVYIIHSHILIFDYLLTDAFSKTGARGFWGFCLIPVASLLGIYLLCWGIEEIRMLLFRVLRIQKLSSRIGEKMDRFLNWS